MIFAVVIALLVVAAAVVGFVSISRRDTGDATGRLTRETVKRDRGEVAVSIGDESPEASGREVERQAVLARIESGSELVTADSAPPVAWTPPDPETVGANRRQFLNRSIVGFMGLGLSGFGAAVLAFLWPSRITGFGAKLNLGDIDALKTEIADAGNFLYLAEGRMWVTRYPESALEKARAAYTPAELIGMEEGLIALFQKCPHLGCRVPDCQSSQWFECPCHGSRYNRVGEKRSGPAPRGMDRFAMEISSNQFVVNTGAIIPGPPIGTNTTGQEPEGPSCVGGASE
ncbi:MAG: Rieske 2Fe-2S domain-containing protein [Acidimicrobiia bacterium]|nr:Rieske 2Fe-2S domain-containing protein [Acidimicrobiia bacterium]